MTAFFEAYFSDYAAACDSMEPARIAAFFHCPCMLVNGDLVSVLSSESAILSNMQGLVAYHEAQLYGCATVSDLTVQPAGGSLAFSTVRWKVQRRDGTPLWDFRNAYNLADYGDGWKILVSTTLPDTER